MARIISSSAPDLAAEDPAAAARAVLAELPLITPNGPKSKPVLIALLGLCDKSVQTQMLPIKPQLRVCFMTFYGNLTLVYSPTNWFFLKVRPPPALGGVLSFPL